MFSALKGETLILETERGGSMQMISGDEKMLESTFTPASTFKIVLAWSGLEAGVVSPETVHRCNDAHVPRTPRDVPLHEAMLYSSNDYFVWLAEKIGADQLRRYVEKSRFFNEPLPKIWPGADKRSVVRGGDLKVTPQQQHHFIQQVMNGKLASSEEIQKKLKQCLEWPTSNSEVRLYGKTGSYGNVVWFNGFGESSNGTKAVTVIIVEKGARRDQAVASFYSRWKMSPPPIFK
jgi:beta-lactamase class D